MSDGYLTRDQAAVIVSQFLVRVEAPQAVMVAWTLVRDQLPLPLEGLDPGRRALRLSQWQEDFLSQPALDEGDEA